ENSLTGSEEEHFVLDDRSAERAAKLFALKIREGLAVRGARAEGLEALILEGASMQRIRPRLGNDVDDAAGGSAKFRVRSRRDHLELLHGVERDVNRGALPAQLLAEHAVVVIAAVHTDVIENSALPVEVDLVAVGALDDSDTRSEGQEILEFAAQDWRFCHRNVV